MKYVFKRARPQGNPRDILKFDSNPFYAIAGQYGIKEVRLEEIESETTREKKKFVVFGSWEGREARFGELTMLTTAGIISAMREYE